MNDLNEVRLEDILGRMPPGTELLLNFLILHGPLTRKEKWRMETKIQASHQVLFLFVKNAALVGRSTY